MIMANCRRLMWTLLLILVTVLQGVATEDDQERCLVADIKVQENFSLDKYLGQWFELKWIPENWFPPEFNYKDFVINYVRYNSTTINGDWVGREADEAGKCIGGTNLILTTETPGKLKYLRQDNNNGTLRSDYWIVLTDYDNYALVWGCREIKNGRCIKEDSWVWSRRPTLSTAHMNMIDAKITEVCLNHTAFFITDQTKECPTSSSMQIQISLAAFLFLYLLWEL